MIAQRATQKWVKEFKYFRATSTGALSVFLDYVAYEYMIDNILDLIKAATSSQSVDMETVVEHCHPLGLLEPAVMKTILAYEDLGEDFHSLYRTVLVDTPVGKYFTQFLQVGGSRRGGCLFSWIGMGTLLLIQCVVYCLPASAGDCGRKGRHRPRPRARHLQRDPHDHY